MYRVSKRVHVRDDIDENEEPTSASGAATPALNLAPTSEVTPVSTPTSQNRQTNRAGVELIHSFESLELAAYPDPASPLGKACTLAKLPMKSYTKVVDWEKMSGAPWTIGWGHTGKLLDGTPVAAGQLISRKEADSLFEQDISSFEKSVSKLVKVDITDNQFAALVSFSYNLGSANLANSTLLKKLNAGDIAGAADEFLKWNKAGGTVMPGLTRRRTKERELFLSV